MPPVATQPAVHASQRRPVQPSLHAHAPVPRTPLSQVPPTQPLLHAVHAAPYVLLAHPSTCSIQGRIQEDKRVARMCVSG